MKIRKQFKFEMAHIVRNAWSRRCSRNIHWHSYELEVLMEGTRLDQGQMLMDFGLVKNFANDFIDAFDHSMSIWNIPEETEVVRFVGWNFERVVITPFSSSAEMQAKFFAEVLYRLVEANKKVYPLEEKENYFPDAFISGARVHETRTGWAEFTIWEDERQLPSTRYPIRIFKPEDIELVIAEPKAIWLSQRIFDEMKYGNDVVELYNSYVEASKY